MCGLMASTLCCPPRIVVICWDLFISIVDRFTYEALKFVWLSIHLPAIGLYNTLTS